MNDLGVVIIHRLPGRIRFRLTRYPRDIKDFLDQIKRHEGIDKLIFSPVTKSLLIYYRPTLVSSIEITVRVGIALSLDYHNDRVRISHQVDYLTLQPIDYYSGLSLIALAIIKGVAPANPLIKYAQYNAGYSTVLAAINHAWLEMKREGIYDLEVISVVYLINALLKGTFLSAAAITWIATFGRHIVEPSAEECYIEASAIHGEDEDFVDVVVSQYIENDSARHSMRLLSDTLNKIIGRDPHKHYYLLMDQIKQMSRKHGNILEGIGKKPSPIYMRLNN